MKRPSCHHGKTHIFRFTLCLSLYNPAHSHVFLFKQRQMTGEQAQVPEPRNNPHTCTARLDHALLSWKSRNAARRWCWTPWTSIYSPTERRWAFNQAIPFVCILRFRIYIWFQFLCVFNGHWNMLCHNHLPRFAEKIFVKSKTVNSLWSFSSPISLGVE